MFVPGRPLQANLIFSLKSRASQSEEPFRGSTLGEAPALLTNITLDWKGLPGTKHSTLLRKFKNYAQKSFMELTPVANFINLFSTEYSLLLADGVKF